MVILCNCVLWGCRSAEYPAVARWYGYIHNVKGVRGPVEKALKQKVLGPKPVAASPDAAAALTDKAATAKAREKAETQASYEGETKPSGNVRARMRSCL